MASIADPKTHHSCAPCKRRVLFLLTLCLAGGGWAWWKSSGDQKEILRLREALTEERARADALEQLLADSHRRMQARMDLLLEGAVAGEDKPTDEEPTSSVPPIPKELLRIAKSSVLPPVRSAEFSDNHSGAKSVKNGKRVVFRALGVRGANLVYRGYDGVHVASPGEALHGVDGKYLGYDRKTGKARVRLRRKEVLLPTRLLKPVRDG